VEEDHQKPAASINTSSSSSSNFPVARMQQQQQQQQQPQGSSSPSFSSWIPVKLPADLSVRSSMGALAMNADGSLLAIGDPARTITFSATSDEDEPPAFRGGVILLQAVEDENGGARPPIFRTVQILEARDDYSEFGRALALSSSTTANSTSLVVGIPRNIGLSLTGPTVQVYVRQETVVVAATVEDNAADAQEQYWEMVDEFPSQSINDASGSWVAVSDDGSRILYSAPTYQREADGDIDSADKADYDAERLDDDQLYDPTTGAVLLWHNGEQETFLHGECAGEGFGQTVSMSSGVDAAGAPPVVVITSARCHTNEEKQPRILVWEGNDSVTNLLVRGHCIMGETGAAAKVSKDGKRIVVLSSCLDQDPGKTRQAIYTFEKEESSQTWVELISDNDVVIDSDLPQYRMSSFAFDDDAKTVVLTAGGRGTDLLCCKWNETTVSWQESWRKVANDSDFGIASAVALSGNGKRLAILGSGTTFSDSARVAVYDLP
jgi:hypothetical protein